MKLWLLKPEHPDAGPWHQWWDKYHGFVIRAESEQRARQMANDSAADENKLTGLDVWLDEKLTFCVELTEYGPEQIVLDDFRNG